jgi:hypothetical protein
MTIVEFIAARHDEHETLASKPPTHKTTGPM